MALEASGRIFFGTFTTCRCEGRLPRTFGRSVLCRWHHQLPRQRPSSCWFRVIPLRSFDRYSLLQNRISTSLVCRILAVMLVVAALVMAVGYPLGIGWALVMLWATATVIFFT